jgi:hypothetical protein
MGSARSPQRRDVVARIAVILVAVALSWALLAALVVAIVLDDVTLAAAIGGTIVAVCALTLVSGDRLHH